MTRVPDRSASWTCIRAVPCRSRRCRRASRIALRARTRPSLRVRRASIPLRIHDLLLGQLLVEEGVLPLLGRQQLLLALQEGRVVAGPVEEPAAVELDDPGGQPLQEDPVVGDEDERAAVAEQERLPASGSTRCRGGWSARRAAGCRARRRGPGPAGRAASSPRRARRTGRRGRAHPGEDGIDPVVGRAGVMVRRRPAPRPPRRRPCRRAPRARPAAAGRSAGPAGG